MAENQYDEFYVLTNYHSYGSSAKMMGINKVEMRIANGGWLMAIWLVDLWAKFPYIPLSRRLGALNGKWQMDNGKL